MKADRSPNPSPNAAAPKKSKTTAQSFSAADFPDLRSFLRGYFHQDMKDEYGSPEEAAREFCSDASGEERSAVAEQWSRLMAQTAGQPIEAVNKILTDPLGSSHTLTAEQVSGISAVFSHTARKGTK
jgi:hypothetical protein